MNVSEKNKLIAEFMGSVFNIDGFVTAIKEYPTGKEGWHYNTENYLKFHESWEWLMPVVEKIQSMGYLVHMNNVSTNINNNCGGTDLKIYFKGGYNSSHGDMKKRTYKAVVEFIKWYNENK